MKESLTLVIALCVVWVVIHRASQRANQPTTQPAAELTHRSGKIPAEASVVDQQQEPMPGVYDFRDFLNALMQVESGGNPKAIGDGGASKGLYQIGKPYWIDAKVDVTYETGVWDKDACEAVMWNYWTRYCEEALYELDFETLARIHNGGPRGESKECTKPYWRKVQAAMQQEK